MKRKVFIDNTKKHSDLIDKDIKKLLPIYKELVVLASNIQEKLSKNFYRVSDIEDLREKVRIGTIKPARYSIIEEQDGVYKLVKYSDFFKNDFSKVILLLNKLSENLQKGEYKDYIDSLSRAFLNNNFIEAYKNWILLGNKYKYDFIFLPTEPDLDKEFGTMLSFDASLRVLVSNYNDFHEDEYKKELSNFVSQTPTSSEVHRSVVTDINRISIRVDNILYSAGVHAISGFYGQNLPNERNFVLSWGSKIILYKDRTDLYKSKDLINLAKAKFENFPLIPKDMVRVGLYRVFSHEIAESFMKYADDAERLKNIYLPIREANSDYSGMKNYILTMLKHNKTEDISNLAYFYVLSCVNHYQKRLDPKTRTPHFASYVIAFNHFVAKKGVTYKKGKIVVNPKIVLKVLSDLSNKMIYFLTEGTEKEARNYVKKYSDEKNLKKVYKVRSFLNIPRL
ncbi:hypothetical protein KA001_02005 [Patescibacteria group bacterium]|nr:hypothetical protein [Patescibacteria group bacterium]